jgi:hypothetical protein
MPGEAVPATCGIFVQANETGAGTPTDPTGDLAQALLDVPNAQAVYICGSDTFTGSFTMPGGRSIFGGLACGAWTYDDTQRPKLMGNPDVPTLVVSGPGATKLEDFDVENPPAVALGASSIALVVETATTDIARCNLTSGTGAAGPDGADQPQTNGAVGAGGMTGVNACVSAVQNDGAPLTMNDCGGGNVSVGGSGGDGLVANGTDGADGTVGSLGSGGIGQPNMGMWSCGVGTGGGGDNGSPGSPGSPGSGKGTLASSGFTPAPGGAGSGGTPGQGGGGGGGAKGQAGCAGASGGAGGAGGCGGTGAQGGGGGGASVALVALNADITVMNSTLLTAAGGTGGTGGLGQPGASGGNPGFGGMGSGPALPACPGGLGGVGGAGGGGGGGRGGHSSPIVFVGPEPMVTSSTLTKGMGGAGGTGIGNGIDPGMDGIVGGSCSVMDFTGASESCTEA